MSLEHFDNMNWEYPDGLAVDILEAIQYLGDNPNVKRMDGEGFKVYWVGSNVLRIDIQHTTLVR